VDDPRAIAVLDRAMEALSPSHISWLECGIWQSVRLPGLSYDAEGRYLLAPDHRFRMEVRTHLPDAVGTLLTVSDGANLWEASRAGDGPWVKVSRLGLAEVLGFLDGPAGSPRLRAEFFEGPTFGGVGPLVRTLRSCLIWIKQDTVRRDSREQIELTGVWPAGRLRELAPADRPWPPGLPRQCRLCFDASTLWPRRIEWWGPAASGQDEVILAEMEFRDPIVNRPLSPEQCARAFSFDPGDAEVEDRTGGVTANLTTRAQQLAAEAGSP
jgi:hypothetical protein